MKIKRNCIFVLDKEPNNTDAKIRYRIKWEGYTIAFGVGYRADVAKLQDLNNTRKEEGTGQCNQQGH
jgi:hypothetical protein